MMAPTAQKAGEEVEEQGKAGYTPSLGTCTTEQVSALQLPLAALEVLEGEQGTAALSSVEALFGHSWQAILMHGFSELPVTLRCTRAALLKHILQAGNFTH